MKHLPGFYAETSLDRVQRYYVTVAKSLTLNSSVTPQIKPNEFIRCVELDTELWCQIGGPGGAWYEGGPSYAPSIRPLSTITLCHQKCGTDPTCLANCKKEL